MKGLTGWLMFGVAAIVVMYIVFHVDAIKDFVAGTKTTTTGNVKTTVWGS